MPIVIPTHMTTFGKFSPKKMIGCYGCFIYISKDLKKYAHEFPIIIAYYFHHTFSIIKFGELKIKYSSGFVKPCIK
jgi:hypothetical protein